jgi:hypothetical protein
MARLHVRGQDGRRQDGYEGKWLILRIGVSSHVFRKVNPRASVGSPVGATLLIEQLTEMSMRGLYEIRQY